MCKLMCNVQCAIKCIAMCAKQQTKLWPHPLMQSPPLPLSLSLSSPPRLTRKLFKKGTHSPISTIWNKSGGKKTISPSHSLLKVGLCRRVPRKEDSWRAKGFPC